MNYIASIAIIFTVSCKKSDEATSEEKFSSFLQNTTQFPGRYIDYVTRNIVKAPLHVAYGLVDCAKYQSDENIVKAIELALIEGIDTWIAPMRKVGKAITNKDIKISRIEKLEENSCRLDIGDKKYHLEVVFVCGDPANQQKCGVRSRAFFPNREGDRDQVGDFSIPPWFYVFNEQWAGNPDVHNSIEGIHIENTSFSKYVLLHELGHVFGLVDTYVVGGGVKTGQPHSIMSSAIPFQNSTGKLTLADDDIRGAQWLYNYFHNKGQLQDCLFPDYEARHDNAYGLMCVPKNVLLDSIKQALSHDAHAMNQITLELLS